MSVCPTCGGPVALCPRCSAPVGGKFCSSCGAAVEGPPARAVVPEAHPGPPVAPEEPILRSGVLLTFGGSLGMMKDAHGASGQVKVFGEMRIEGAPGAPLDEDALSTPVKGATLSALKQAVAEAAASGAIAIAPGLVVPPGVKERAALLLRASPEAAPGLTYEITMINAQVMDLVPAPIAGAGFSSGQSVLVQWSDGNRYPAHVLQAAGDRCLVSFPNGTEDWVPVAYLSLP